MGGVVSMGCEGVSVVEVGDVMGTEAGATEETGSPVEVGVVMV